MQVALCHFLLGICFEKDTQAAHMYTHLIISQWDSSLYHLLTIGGAYSNVSDSGLYWAFITIYSYFATWFCRLFQNDFLNCQKKNHSTKAPQWLATVSLTYLSKIFCSLQQKVTKFWVWVRITFGQQLLIKLSSRHCNKNRLYVDSVSFLDSLSCKYLLLASAKERTAFACLCNLERAVEKM